MLLQRRNRERVCQPARKETPTLDHGFELLVEVERALHDHFWLLVVPFEVRESAFLGDVENGMMVDIS